MAHKIVLLFVVLQILAVFTGSYSDIINPYCDLQYCHNGSHTLCKYPNPLIGFRCGTLIRHGLTEYEINRILELHNKLRKHIYTGNELRGNPGPMPKAREFSYLEWDTELAIIAQRWTEHCHYRHDTCRHVERFIVGQAIGFESTLGDVEVLTVDLPIQKWYEEVVRFNSSHIYIFNRDYAETVKSHNFSQMIWAFTTVIGCGAMRYYDGFYNRLLLVCNYAPRGNYPGKSVYPTHRRKNDKVKKNKKYEKTLN